MCIHTFVDGNEVTINSCTALGTAAAPTVANTAVSATYPRNYVPPSSSQQSDLNIQGTSSFGGSSSSNTDGAIAGGTIGGVAGE
jgi:hypothetical protein